MNINIEDVVKFAKQQQYYGARYLGEWEDYQVYEPTFKDNKFCIVGQPYVILVKGDEIRLSEPEEALTCLSTFPEDEEYYKEVATNWLSS